MDFINKKYLLRQHRFVGKDSLIHLQRKKERQLNRFIVYVLDKELKFDFYFIVWFCGFFELSGEFKLVKLQKIYFAILLYFTSYKMLRWLRYQFNFGDVFYNFKKQKYFLFIFKFKHLRILIHLFNGYLNFFRSLRQFYLWLKYYSYFQKQNVSMSIPFSILFKLLPKAFFLGLIDNKANFKIYKSERKKGRRFKSRFRFVFFIDLPLYEKNFFSFLIKFFNRPVFLLRSTKTIRLVISAIEDYSVLIRLLYRFKLFNRLLRLRYENWKTALDYIILKNLKYRRPQHIRLLLERFATDYSIDTQSYPDITKL